MAAVGFPAEIAHASVPILNELPHPVLLQVHCQSPIRTAAHFTARSFLLCWHLLGTLRPICLGAAPRTNLSLADAHLSPVLHTGSMRPRLSTTN